jgi:hypothetical protein
MRTLRSFFPGALAVASLSVAGSRPRASDEAGPPPFDAQPFPADESAAPTPDEWKTAPVVALTASSPRASVECRAYRVREWLKIHCDRGQAFDGGSTYAGVRLLAGRPDGVSVWVSPFDQRAPRRGGCELIMPVRPGDRRVLQIYDLDQGYYEGPGYPRRAFVVDEVWMEGDKGPTVIVR